MSITTSTGLFSGIPTQDLINQLIQIESRPKVLAETRLIELQVRQTALLDINSQMSALRTAARDFRTTGAFDRKRATVSDPSVLTATASNEAQAGTYEFRVDRLVSTQQFLGRGFADRSSTGLEAGTWTFESADARLDRDLNLSDLNAGDGVRRGSIEISDITQTFRVDLSTAATLSEVVDAINTAAADAQNDTRAEVRGSSIVLTSANGINAVRSVDASGTAEDLGIAFEESGFNTVNEYVGTRLWSIGRDTPLSQLNDGAGVDMRAPSIVVGGGDDPDFTITWNLGADSRTIDVDVSEVFEDSKQVRNAATTVGEVVDRINEAIAAANADPDDPAGVSIAARIDAATNSIVIETTDAGATLMVQEGVPSGGSGVVSRTAADLGILTSSDPADLSDTVQGSTVLADANTTLLSSLNGGAGLSGSTLDFTLRDGSTLSLDLTGLRTVEAVISAINAASPSLAASLDERGTGISVTDSSGDPDAPAATFAIAGDAAASLGLAGSPDDDNTIGGESLQLRYIGWGTSLASLNNGAGVGTGTIRLTDSLGQVGEVDIGEDVRTVGQLIRLMQDTGLDLDIGLNETGDGLLIAEPDGIDGSVKIKVEDVTGQVGLRLNLRGEAADTGDDNRLDGTFERSITFEDTDTLDDIVAKINADSVGVVASVISDGSGIRPFRLSLTATAAGVDGRMVVNTGDFDLGLTTLDRGDNARVLYGTAGGGQGLLLQSSTNRLDGVVRGVTIDLNAASEETVRISISNDTSAIESQIDRFVQAFNSTVNRIDFQTRYVEETDERGPLIGDGTMIGLKSALYRAVNGTNLGFTAEIDRLVEVGVSVGDEGQLAFDRAAFRDAYNRDPAGVEDLFTRRLSTTGAGEIDLGNGITATDPNPPTSFDQLGILPGIEALADRYVTAAGGILTNQRSALDTQIESQEDRIASLDESLLRKRAQYEAEFLAMERAIAQLQGQQSSLAQISSLIG